MVFLRIQRKSMKEDACKQRLTIERRNPLSTDLWVKPNEWLSRICFIVLYFVADGPFTADGGLL